MTRRYAIETTVTQVVEAAQVFEKGVVMQSSKVDAHAALIRHSIKVHGADVPSKSAMMADVDDAGGYPLYLRTLTVFLTEEGIREDDMANLNPTQIKEVLDDLTPEQRKRFSKRF